MKFDNTITKVTAHPRRLDFVEKIKLINVYQEVAELLITFALL